LIPRRETAAMTSVDPFRIEQCPWDRGREAAAKMGWRGKFTVEKTDTRVATWIHDFRGYFL
jgi:hypothetical protein